MARRASLLPLFGPARLEAGGEAVKMQRKSLGLLYLLALDGPTSRDRAAHLLWGPGRLRNLRVELHGLNRVLSQHGSTGFPAGQDPLKLPEGIQIRREAAQTEDVPLDGLDDLSRGFQGWLDVQRCKLEPSHHGNLPFRSLVEDLASDLRAPAVVIVEGLPSSGRRAFAQALAARLELPLREVARFGTGAIGLHFVPHDTPYDHGLVDRIVADRRGVWVVERSAFGEDPRLVLDLREVLPPDRVRYVKLPSLDWYTARLSVLADVPYEEAAQLHMVTEGMQDYLEEMLLLRPDEGFGVELPMPQRVAAAYKREARRLELGARYALERLSVQPGSLHEELIDALGAVEHLHELERRRWLRFDDGWRWNFEVARRIVYATLLPGQRRSYHALAAACLRSSDRTAAARFHAWMGDGGTEPVSDGLVRPLDPLEPWTSALVRLPATWSPLEPEALPSRASWVDDTLWWSRPLCPSTNQSLLLTMPDDATVLRLRGNIYWDAPLTCDGAIAGVRVAAVGNGGPDIMLSPAAAVPSLRSGDVIYPAGGDFDLWLLVPGGARIEIFANGAGFVATFAIECADAQRLHGETVEAREAYELVRSRSPSTPKPSGAGTTWSYTE